MQASQHSSSSSSLLLLLFTLASVLSTRSLVQGDEEVRSEVHSHDVEITASGRILEVADNRGPSPPTPTPRRVHARTGALAQRERVAAAVASPNQLARDTSRDEAGALGQSLASSSQVLRDFPQHEAPSQSPDEFGRDSNFAKGLDRTGVASAALQASSSRSSSSSSSSNSSSGAAPTPSSAPTPAKVPEAALEQAPEPAAELAPKPAPKPAPEPASETAPQPLPAQTETAANPPGAKQAAPGGDGVDATATADANVEKSKAGDGGDDGEEEDEDEDDDDEEEEENEEDGNRAGDDSAKTGKKPASKTEEESAEIVPSTTTTTTTTPVLETTVAAVDLPGGKDPSSKPELLKQAKTLALEKWHSLIASKQVPIYNVTRCHDIFEVKDYYKREAHCPEECPYVGLIHRKWGLSCHFQCVQMYECGSGLLDPNASVADTSQKLCRRCFVAGCMECADGSSDRCKKDKCEDDYVYFNGKCKGRVAVVITGVFTVVGLFVTMLVLWWFDLLCCRGRENRDGLCEGLRYREKMKVKNLNVKEGEVGAYPITTNLSSEKNADVGGPGLILHFNFLMMSVIWPLGVALLLLGWSVYAGHVSFLHVNMESDTTPTELCGAVHHGEKLKIRFTRVTNQFVLALYVMTLVGSLVYCALQSRKYGRMKKSVTMKDFMLVIEGLSKQSGRREAEVETKRFLEKQLDMELVGVSLCWAYADVESEAYEVLEADLRGQEEDPVPLPPQEEFEAKLTEKYKFPLHRKLARWEAKFLSSVTKVQEEESWKDPEKVLEMLEDLRTSGFGFAVFRTEAERDEAYKKCEEAGGYQEPSCPGANRVRLRYTQMEPTTIIWKNYTVKKPARFLNMWIAIIKIVLFQGLWGICFYYPYAKYMSAFTYAHGEEPDSKSALAFSLIVTLGNQINYFWCGYCTDRIGFFESDSWHSFYTVSYTLANLLNVCVDVVVTGVLSYKIMKSQGVSVSDGRELEDMNSIHEILETFPMQKTLAAQLWLYSFPATFLLPYFIEPFFVICIPYYLMKVLVRSCPLIVGRRAEVAMTAMFATFDLGRYADMIVNMLLCVATLFLAQGYWLKTFAACAVSNLWIICLDHWRCLRAVPLFQLASNRVEVFAQDLLAVGCSAILVAWLFRENCCSHSVAKDCEGWCYRSWKFAILITWVVIVHTLVQILIQRVVLPHLFQTKYEPSDEDFSSVARRIPANPFNANPIHCLRSKYVYKHEPHCFFYSSGKEHLQKVNPNIGCFYSTHIRNKIGKTIIQRKAKAKRG